MIVTLHKTYFLHFLISSLLLKFFESFAFAAASIFVLHLFLNSLISFNVPRQCRKFHMSLSVYMPLFMDLTARIHGEGMICGFHTVWHITTTF